MAALSREQITATLRGISLRQVRLASGVVLFAYLVSHFLNHALGNISMEALASGVYWHTLFWHSLPVTLVFYASCLVHTGLGIWALYERRQFRWKAIEPLQLVLGLSIPALIITHVIGVRLGYSLYGHDLLYPQVFFAYWISWPPLKMWMLFAVLVISWAHGCIGLYFWLRLKPFYRRAAPYLLATAVLIPTERPVLTMASSIATIARLAEGRFRACFGTGFTARKAVGQRPPARLISARGRHGDHPARRSLGLRAPRRPPVRKGSRTAS